MFQHTLGVQCSRLAGTLSDVIILGGTDEYPPKVAFDTAYSFVKRAIKIFTEVYINRLGLGSAVKPIALYDFIDTCLAFLLAIKSNNCMFFLYTGIYWKIQTVDSPRGWNLQVLNFVYNFSNYW